MTISATTQGLQPGVCTSTSRPSVPFDGMLIYETDTNRVAVYDTSAWVYKTPDTTVGSVLQVASTVKTDTYSMSTETYTDVTGLTVSITPKSTASKIFITAAVSVCQQVGTNNAFLQLARGGTALCVGDAAGVRIRATSGVDASGGNFPDNQVLSFLDSPNTTSSTTYSVQIRRNGNTSGSVFINRSSGDSDNASLGRFASTITVMEIAG